MEKLKAAILNFLLKKYALGYLTQGWGKLRGYKTQVFSVLAFLTWVGEVTGQIPKELSGQLYTIFGSGAGFAFLQKLQRVQPQVEALVEEIKKGEIKP